LYIAKHCQGKQSLVWQAFAWQQECASRLEKRKLVADAVVRAFGCNRKSNAPAKPKANGRELQPVYSTGGLLYAAALQVQLHERNSRVAYLKIFNLSPCFIDFLYS
jgi:hypothetical protein